MKRTKRVLAAAAVPVCAGLLFVTVSAATNADALVSRGATSPVGDMLGASEFGLRPAVLGHDSVRFQQVKKSKAERKAKREAKRKARKEKRAARKAKRSQEQGQAQ